MGSLTEHVNGPFVFIFVMVSYVLAFLPVSMVILELVVHDQYFYARLCRVRPRLARQSRLVWTGLKKELIDYDSQQQFVLLRTFSLLKE